MKYTSIQERLAAQQGRAWMTLRRLNASAIRITLLALALGLGIVLSGAATQRVLQVEIFVLTADADSSEEGFAVGIRFSPIADQDLRHIIPMVAKLRTALKEQVPGFVKLELFADEAEGTANDQTFLCVARFTEQVALERIAAALKLVFSEFAGSQMTVAIDAGSSAKLSEE